jgi:hypothetical protein
MERLELYDLDKLITIPTINYQLPPPLPPPRKYQQRRPSMNPTFERYKFLCNMTRSETDPIYAATPMFTTIPQLSQVKSHRQLLGSYVRLENVTPLSCAPSKSPEPKIINEEKENDHNGSIENEHEQENDDKENQSDSGSSRSDEQENVNVDDILNDDHTNEIVEQIFNRDEKN